MCIVTLLIRIEEPSLSWPCKDIVLTASPTLGDSFDASTAVACLYSRLHHFLLCSLTWILISTVRPVLPSMDSDILVHAFHRFQLFLSLIVGSYSGCTHPSIILAFLTDGAFCCSASRIPLSNCCTIVPQFLTNTSSCPSPSHARGNHHILHKSNLVTNICAPFTF